MLTKKDIITNNSHDVCITSDALIAYAQGVSDATVTRKVELHVSDCMLCSDALDALLSTDIEQFTIQNKEIQQALKQQYSTAKIIHFPAIRWAAAASVLLLVASYFYFSKKGNPSNNNTEIVTVEPQKVVQDTFSKTTVVSTDIALVEPKVANIKSNFSPKTEKEDIALVSVGETTITGFTEEVESSPGRNTGIGTLDYYSDLSKPSDDGSTKAETSEKLPTSPSETIGGDQKKLTQVTGGVTITSPSPPASIVTNASGTYDMKDIDMPTVSGNYKVSENAKLAKSTADAKKNIAKKTNYDELLQQGIKAYYRNNLKKALADFEAILALDASNEDALFYKGLVLAAAERCNDAMPILSDFAFYPSTSPYYSEAQWTIANCHLKMMMKESAKNILQILAEYDNLRQEDAKRLLEKLK